MSSKQARWIVLGVALVSLITWSALAGRGREAHESGLNGIQLDPVATGLTKDAADRAIIAHLRDGGADMSRTRRVNHHIDFGTSHRDDARRSAAELRSMGYTTSIATLHDGGWELTATTHVVVTLGRMQREEDEITSVVRVRAGAYDGWEAAAKP